MITETQGGTNPWSLHQKTDVREDRAYADNSPEAVVPIMNLELRHITEIQRGNFRGCFQVGLCLVPETQ